MGLDEANIDATPYLIKNNMNNDEGRIKLAKEIRNKVFEVT